MSQINHRMLRLGKRGACIIPTLSMHSSSDRISDSDIPSSDGHLGAMLSPDDRTAALPLEEDEGVEDEVVGVLEYELRAEGELVELELDECRWCCCCLGGIGTEEDAMVNGPVR